MVTEFADYQSRLGSAWHFRAERSFPLHTSLSQASSSLPELCKAELPPLNSALTLPVPGLRSAPGTFWFPGRVPERCGSRSEPGLAAASPGLAAASPGLPAAAREGAQAQPGCMCECVRAGGGESRASHSQKQ